MSVATGRPSRGSRQSGATSASGSRTKARSASRGCGMLRPGSSMTAAPQASRSRSMTRAAHRAPRVRPRRCSTACRSASVSRGGRSARKRATALTNQGWPATGAGALRYHDDTTGRCPSSCPRAASACRQVVSGGAPAASGRFAPTPTKTSVDPPLRPLRKSPPSPTMRAEVAPPPAAAAIRHGETDR